MKGSSTESRSSEKGGHSLTVAAERQYENQVPGQGLRDEKAFWKQTPRRGLSASCMHVMVALWVFPGTLILIQNFSPLPDGRCSNKPPRCPPLVHSLHLARAVPLKHKSRHSTPCSRSCNGFHHLPNGRHLGLSFKASHRPAHSHPPVAISPLPPPLGLFTYICCTLLLSGICISS